MDNTLNILVIGDSASAPFGIFEGTYLDCLLRRRFNRPVEFTNLSTFNMTTVDAWFLADKWLKKSFDCVILALGNCDACRFGYEKRIQPMLAKSCNQRLNRFLSDRAKKKTPITRRLPPYTFRHIAISPPLDKGVVDPHTFASNIKRIYRLANRHRAQLFILNLDSNKAFPPCNNLGNYSYYKIFGLPTSLPYSGLGESNALNEALYHHDAGDLSYAEDLYGRMAKTNPDNELLHIANNNLAAIHFDRGNMSNARAALDAIPAKAALAPIVVYNRAIVARIQGNEDEARSLFSQAYEEDYGSYRIKTRYREAAAATKDAEQIDCAEFVSQEDFQDYCHPGLLSHEALAGELDKRLRNRFGFGEGDIAPRMTYVPENPDIGVGFTDDFFWHFGITSLPDSQVGHGLAEIQASYPAILKQADKIIDDPQLASINSILSHPLFGCASFLEIVHPRLKTDLGRIPELFSLRMMIPVYEKLKATPSPLEEMENLSGYVPSLAKIRQWWPALRLPTLEESAEVMSRIAKGVNWQNVVERMELLLLHSLNQGAVYSNRIRGITNWFMRESIIFSPVSRPNQMYRRKDFLSLTDCILYHWTSAPRSTEIEKRFSQITRWTERAVSIHEEYVPLLRPDRPNPERLKTYGKALNTLARQYETVLGRASEN